MAISDLFRNALKPFLKSKGNSDYKDLNEGKKITFSPRSARFTYDNMPDFEYDKDWTPATKTEKESLTPEGFYRVGDRKAEKDRLKEGIFDSAFRRAAKENPNALLSKLNEKAEKEANEVFDEGYREKAISIPSTALSEIKYDPKTAGLRVKFQGESKWYFYPNVPMEEIQSLMKADSKGEYFIKNIHDVYTMNPGHRPAGKSGNYINMNTGKKASAKQVAKWFKKYSSAYDKSNTNRMAKLKHELKVSKREG